MMMAPQSQPPVPKPVLKATGWPDAPSANVDVNRGPAAPVYSNQQTAGNFNYQQAKAYRDSDPRGHAKQFARGGISSGLGQAAEGAAKAANAYSNGMAQAYGTQQNDRWENASSSLQDLGRRTQFGTSLAGLQENDMQGDRMHDLRNQQQNQGLAMSVLGTAINGMQGPPQSAGPFNSMQQNLLSGLLSQ